MNLNTLHFCTSESWGGREIYSCTVMSELKNAGCGVYAVCKSKSSVENFLKEQGISCINLSSNARVSFSSINQIKFFVRQKNIDVVHTHFSKDIWPASLALMGNCKQKLFFSNYSGGRRKKDIFHRIIYSRIDGVFTSSAKLADQLVEMYSIRSSKIHLLPYGRRIENYKLDENKRAEIRARHGVKCDDILIGTMVRIDPRKGPYDLVKSLLHIDKELRKGLKIIIVGEPSRRVITRSGQSVFEPECEAHFNEIKMFIEENGFQESVILPGFQNDLVGYLGAMDIFVFPSHNELYSLVVLDAMCMQLPVIATRAGGNLEQVRENETGLFYEVADSRDLAKKLSLYLKNPQIPKAHGQQARSFVMEKHDMDKMIGALIRYYEN